MIMFLSLFSDCPSFSPSYMGRSYLLLRTHGIMDNIRCRKRSPVAVIPCQHKYVSHNVTTLPFYTDGDSCQWWSVVCYWTSYTASYI